MPMSGGKQVKAKKQTIITNTDSLRRNVMESILREKVNLYTAANAKSTLSIKVAISSGR